MNNWPVPKKISTVKSQPRLPRGTRLYNLTMLDIATIYTSTGPMIGYCFVKPLVVTAIRNNRELRDITSLIPEMKGSIALAK